MALLNTHSEANLVREEAEFTQPATLITSNGSSLTTTVISQSSGRFKYVGMTEAAANLCKIDMQMRYPGAAVSCYPVGGGRMWEVRVTLLSTNVSQTSGV